MPVRSVVLRILGDKRDVTAALDWTQTRAHQVTDKPYTLKINTDVQDPAVKLAAIEAELKRLRELSDKLKLGAGIFPPDQANRTLADLAKVNLELDKISRRISSPRVTLLGLDKSNAELLDLAARLGKISTAEKDAAVITGTLGDRFRGLLPGAIIFGVASFAQWVTLGVHAAFELAAILVPAAFALTVFGASLLAAAPTVQLMTQREQAMFTATQILGQNMPGLTGNISKLNDQFKPQIFSVWGDALTVINNKTGAFGGIFQTAIMWVQKFAARISVDMMNSQSAFNTLLNAGKRDLGGLGQIVMTLGNAFMNFIKASEMTHVSSFFLGAIGVAAKLLDLLTKIPGPLLAVGIGLHAVYLWGGLAVGGLFRIGGAIPIVNRLGPALDKAAAGALSAAKGMPFVVSGLRGVGMAADGTAVKTGILRTSLTLLKAVPVWGWVAAGVIALVGLELAFAQNTSATERFIAGLNSMIAGTSDALVFNKLAGAIGQVNSHLNQVNQQANTLANNTSVGRFGLNISVGMAVAASATSDLVGENTVLIGQLNNYGHGIAYIMKTYKVDYPSAIAIATRAGVNLTSNITGTSKAAQIARQQITGLMTGFEQLQTPAGVVGKDFQALAFASNDITQKVSQLNSAWDTWTKSVTGSQSGFDTFAQGLTVLSQDSGTFRYRLGLLTVTGQQTKAAIDSLTASGINLNQAFVQEVGNLGQYIDALRTSGASTDQVTKAMKGGIAALIPYAAGSKEATSELFALAQQANYTGKNSIAGLASWAGVKAPAALKLMKQQADAATIAASNLANTISRLLNVQFQQDIVQSSGASAALAKYTSDLVHNQQNTANGRADRQNLINDLILAGMNAKQAAKYVDGLSTSLGKVPPAATVTYTFQGGGQISVTTAVQDFISTHIAGHMPHASGGLITGGVFGKDSVLGLLMPGEVVVPTGMVRAGAVDHLRGALPGFGTGGFVGGPWLTGEEASVTNTEIQTRDASNQNILNKAVQMVKQVAQELMGGIPGNVKSYANLVLSVLGMLGQPAADLGIVLRQMATESGGQPAIVNTSDSNWFAGHPSVGLMQVIAGTFDTYAGPFRGVGPFEYGVSINPLANVYAGLNYAIHRYPGDWTSVLGQGHGYGFGGTISEPILGVGASGMMYRFGELGKPEYVSDRPGGGGVTVIVNCPPTVNPDDVARSIHQMLRDYKRHMGNKTLGIA